MPLIKRYPNRKLYDTSAKRYVTLEDIAGMIRDGQDVQVIDYESGEDLTSLTLSQIILDQEKKQSGFLPRSLLTGLIRTGGDTLEFLLRSVQNSLPLGKAVLEERLSKLVAAGLLSSEQAKAVAAALQPENVSELAKVDENLSLVLNRLNIPSNKDIQELHQQLAQLNQKLEILLLEENVGELPDSGEHVGYTEDLE